MNPSQAPETIEHRLRHSRQASFKTAVLTGEEKNQALEIFAQLIEAESPRLLAANQQDLAEQADRIDPALYQRLKLDEGKIRQLVQGIRDVIALPDPVGQITLKTRLDDGLILERMTVPLGVIGIIFESRPDVIPQILSLILKSGNAVVLKGGKEALHSNTAFMDVVAKLNDACPFLPPYWAQMIDTREAVRELLQYHQYVDLVIPRGSNELVQSIMANTKIPVLGHADGICHIFLEQSADLAQAIPVIIDAKAQYPSACNAVETLLVEAGIAEAFLPQFAQAAGQAGITMKGCDRTRQLITGCEPVTDWHTEYGAPVLAVRIVEGITAAIDHINTYGSHHTDCILTRDETLARRFIAGVDSASVFVNASTRFADGFRYGFGAESGISTAKTHARGPVGMDGLVIYKYVLCGHHQKVADYVGEHPKPFLHEDML